MNTLYIKENKKGKERKRERENQIKGRQENKQISANYIYLCPKQIAYNIRGSLNKFPDFFRMGTFIDSTHMTL